MDDDTDLPETRSLEETEPVELVEVEMDPVYLKAARRHIGSRLLRRTPLKAQS